MFIYSLSNSCNCSEAKRCKRWHVFIKYFLLGDKHFESIPLSKYRFKVCKPTKNLYEINSPKLIQENKESLL